MTLEEDRDAKGPSTIAVRAGESLNTCKINFSPDGKWIFVCCGSRVEVYSYTSHDVVYTLLYHSATVTGIAVNPKNKMQLLSASLDGRLAVWDYTDGSLLKVVDFGRPLFKFGVRPGNREPSIFFTVQKNGVTPESKDADYAVVGVASHVIIERKPSVAPSNLLEDSQRYLQMRKKPQDLVFSHEGSYVASYSGKKLMICDIEAENFYNYHLEHAITAVTFHPCKMCLATGNTHGEIHLWYDFAQPGSRVVTTTMHWHAHAVGDICFTSDGTYLLSGGEESVLVLWQLDTGKRQFRPRLGCPITALACSPADHYFTATLESNVVRIVSGLDTKVEWTLGGLMRAHSHENGIRTGLVQCGADSKLVALNSTPGFLQFYNPGTDSIAYEVDVASLNFVSRPDEAAMVLTTVDHVAFSQHGHWMATVESRDDGKTAAELRLKFWEFNDTKQRFVVNTCVDPPHTKDVTSLTFQPDFTAKAAATARNHSPTRSKSKPRPLDHTHLMAVSTSVDGHFKSWVAVEGGKKVPVSWACRSVGYYHGLPCRGSVFSPDGTLLAVNFEKYLTLWDPVTCEIRRTFKPVISADEFVAVVFGHASSSHCLLASSTRHLQVWDLLSCSLLWCVKTSVDLLISDPFSSLAATFVPSLSGETHLYVFNPSSPTPLAVHDSVCPGPVVGAVFMPQTRTSKHPPSSSSSSSSSPPSSTLYFINKQQVLYSLSSQRDDQDQENNSSLGGSTGPTVNPPATTGGGQFDSQKAFREIFGRATLREEEKEADRLGGGGGGGGGGGVVVPPRSSSAVRQQLLSAPAHVLPPISALCTPFLLTLLPASHTTAAAAAAAAGSDGGALNGDDADSEMEHSAARDSDSEEEEEEESSSQPGQQDSSSTTARSLAAAHKPTTTAGVVGVWGEEEEEEEGTTAAAAGGQSLRESGSVGDYEWLTEQFGVL